jgi:ribosomal protein L12E/L44/L45/RPP1/RPP2
MPAQLNQDAVAYLKQQNLPITTTSLNRTMNLLQQQPDLRPSYAGQGAMDVDVETMRPIEGKSLPPLKDSTEYDNEGNIAGSFSDAFRSARKALGAGKQFSWRGKKYTTDYKEEVNSGQPTAKSTSGEIDKFGDDASPHDPIDSEAVDDIQAGLAAEDQEFAAEDAKQRNMKSVLGPRGAGIGPRKMPMTEKEIADRDMNSMLVAIGLGGAAAGGAAYAANRKPAPKTMTEGDLYNKSPDPNAGKMTEGDLYGKKSQQMTGNDLFFDDQIDRMMTQEDLTGNQVMQDQDFLKSLENDQYALDDERAAAKAIRTKNKVMAKKLLPKLENLNDIDSRLVKLLKGLM